MTHTDSTDLLLVQLVVLIIKAVLDDVDALNQARTHGLATLVVNTLGLLLYSPNKGTAMTALHPLNETVSPRANKLQRSAKN